MSSGNKPKATGYSTFREYKRRFFSAKKEQADYSLPPEEFGRKLAEDYAEEYKRVIQDFLRKNPIRKR
jgi:hypothetical protein